VAKILVVDDNAASRELTCALLHFHGHLPLQAADGAEALKVIREQRPRLVISDILMPTMDGYELVQNLRADPEFADTRVIFCTAVYREREAVSLAGSVGVTELLVKPFEADELLAAVERMLHAGAPSAADVTSDFSGVHRRLLMGKVSEQAEALQAAVGRLAALHDLNLRISSERDTQALLADVCRGARDLIGARYAVLLVRDRNDGQQYFLQHSGLDAALTRSVDRPALDDGLCGAVLADRRSRRVLNSSGDPRAIGLTALYPPVHSALIAPVMSQTFTYGWICLANKVGEGEFTEDDERALSILAAQVGRIYENSSLYAEVQRHARALEVQVLERNRAMEEQRESELRFRQLAENIHDAFWICTADYRRMLYISPAYEQIWQRSREEAYSHPVAWARAVHPDDRARVYAEFMRRAGDSAPFAIEYRIQRPDGSVRWIVDRAFPIRDGGGRTYRVAGVARDVTDRKSSEETIQRLSRLYAVLSGINSMIVRMRDRAALFQEACRIAVAEGGLAAAWIGVLDPDTGTGHIVASYGTEEATLRVVRRDMDSPTSSRPTSKALRVRQPVVCNDTLTDPAFTELQVHLQRLNHRSVAACPILAEGQPPAVMGLVSTTANFFDAQVLALLREMTGDIAFGLQYIAKEERLAYLAVYDVLTGLPNSALFLDQLGLLARSAQTARRGVAVLMIDIEGFKHVNDTLGRHVGDAVLRQAGERMRTAMAQHCCVARVGADAFAVALGDLDHAEEAATELHERLVGAFARPMAADEHEVPVSFRTGIALYPADGEEPTVLFRNAEAALRKAQDAGESYAFYSPQITATVAARAALEQRLRRAVERDEFVLHYQPKVDLQRREIVGLEALLRWNDPDHGLILPDRFIPALEGNGLIVRVGRMVMDMALADYRRWRAAGLAPPRIAVNVSPAQLRQPGFVDSVAQLLRGEVGPEALELEITESMLMEDLEGSVRMLRSLSDLGVHIAIDDFGTGYSSLRYLAKLPISTVKIDRSFISAMTADPDSMTIVATIISLAHSLKLDVCGEGVETDEQSRVLSVLRCDTMQGYLFSRPLSAADIAEQLRRSARNGGERAGGGANGAPAQGQGEVPAAKA
jgi:diguanylate cyclase (GGDEF)-like protein/PAS domain S-box-containing protein